MKTKLLIALLMASMMLSCKPEKDDDDDENTPTTQNPVINAEGCFPQEILAWNLNPLYTYTYNEDYPTVLEEYRTYDEISGNVQRTYVYQYHFDTNINFGVVDTVRWYYGDYTAGMIFAETKVYYYTAVDDTYFMDSAKVYGYDPTEDDNLIFKGIIYYTYNNQDQLTMEEYVDYPDNNLSTLYDTYRIEYGYDGDGQLLTQDYYDYNDQLYYYEHYTLTDFLQPNYFRVDNHVLARSLLYAPSQTIGYYSGTGTYTYNYIYQTNDDNYIVTQDVILQNGDTAVKKLITYECY